MEDEQFETFVASRWPGAGIEVDEVDLAVMRVAERVYGPEREALLAADLSAAPVEHDLDPSRPPTGRAGPVTG